MGCATATEESMKTMRWFSLLVILAAHSHAADPKQPTPTPTPDIRNVTKWSVTYWDGLLGQVKGTAYVNWGNSTARVVLKDPQTNSEKTLEATGIEATADELVMTLRGEGFSSERVTAPPTQGISELASGDDTKVRIEGGVGENEFAVKAKARGDSNIVRVALRRGVFGHLNGEWSYYADPITQRNSQGTGRVGWFRLLNRDEIEQAQDVFGPINGGFVGQQSGREQWWPIPLQLSAVEVVDHQLISDENGPVFPAPLHEENPYARYGDEKTRTKWESETARRRILFVVGRNFPTPEENFLGTFHVSGARGSKLLARSKDTNLSDDLKQKFEIGWAKVLANSPEDKQPLNRDMDAALFEITLEDNVLAGPKKFEWNGEERDWLLQFGNNRAQARFVRPLKEVQAADSSSVNELEAAQTFYLPERVAVEVQTRIELPFEQLKVRVGTNRSNDAVQVYPARRMSPGLYRTEFFKIGPESGGIAAKEGEELLATVDHRDLLDNHNFQFVGGVSAKARLLLTPGAREPGKLGGLWKDALLTAAKVAGKENVSLEALPGTESDSIGNMRIAIGDRLVDAILQQRKGITSASGTSRDIPITIGDHAAMLLLREVFVDKMKAQLDWLDGIRTAEDLQKFRDWVEPFLSGDSHAFFAQPQSPYASVKYPSWLSSIPDSEKDAALKKIDDLNETLAGITSVFTKVIPGLIAYAVTGGPENVRWGRGSAFAQIEVTGPDGKAAPFYEAFDQYKNPFAGSFKNEEERRRWQFSATKQAIGKYRDVVDKAKKNAEKIEPSDRKELLKLTGIGFGAVIHDLLPRLMKLESLYTFQSDGQQLQLNERQFREWQQAHPNDVARIGNPASQLWVPDVAARSAVCNLATTQQAVLAQQEYTQVLDQYALLAAASVLTVPVLISDTALASVISLAGNALLWEVTSLQALVETYKGRQDVQFEFGYAIVIGKERLAEAEASKPEWFSTLASIVANGAFVALQAKFETMPKIEREMAVFRGRKICDAKQLQGSTKWFGGLNADEASDVMAYFENCGLRGTRPAAFMPSEDVLALYKAETAGHEARAPPGGEPPAPKPAAEKPVGGAAPEAGSPGFHGATTAVSSLEFGQEIPILRNLPSTGAPAEGAWWYAGKSPSGDPIHYKLGKRLGAGASSEVYVVTDVSGRPKFEKPVVIKFVRDHEIIEEIKKGEKLTKPGQFGTAKQQIDRMKYSQDALKKIGVEYAEIVEFHPDADVPIVIQNMVPLDGENFVMINMRKLVREVERLKKKSLEPLSYDEICKVFPRPMQRAVVRLYRQLADAGYACTDLSLANIYFHKVGNDWVCGILDVDHVVPFGQKTPHFTTEWVRLNQRLFAVFHVTERPIATGVEFMEGMLSFDGLGGNLRIPFLRYDMVRNQLMPCLIDPYLAEEFFPYLKTGLKETKSVPEIGAPGPAAPAPPSKPLPAVVPKPEALPPDANPVLPIVPKPGLVPPTQPPTPTPKKDGVSAIPIRTWPQCDWPPSLALAA